MHHDDASILWTNKIADPIILNPRKLLGSRAYVKSSKSKNDLRLATSLVSGLLTQKMTWFSSVIEEGLTMSCIKSIQRGTYQPALSSSGEVTVTLATRISCSKSLIFIQPYLTSPAASTVYVPMLTDATFKSYGGTWTETNIDTGVQTLKRGTIAYQIIEFA